ncbi:hypothetical protein LOC67_17125 [Stieleria sp. JC731]|uniref:hypothetical protein n=1 Tax=Pirellulaceae TaxID=2691357 RepID=UPI001E381469|nr:hypothetical protein [Stieleria sp. JC731]MCC9602279.1 hypothetical protein [Stieleria sp. JC731]
MSSSRGGLCFDSSLKLRDRVISALRNSGLSESDIQEGGGNVALQFWSSAKSVSHSIIVRNADMAKLMNSMAAIERLFASSKRTFWSPIKQTFAFQSPKPIYAPSESAENAIAGAMQRARATADSIAFANGEMIESLVSVHEIAVASQRNIPGHDEFDGDADVALDFCEIDDSIGVISYPSLGDQKGRGTRRFRVRFALKPTTAD